MSRPRYKSTGPRRTLQQSAGGLLSGGRTAEVREGRLSDQEVARRQSKVSYLHDEVPPLPDRILDGLEVDGDDDELAYLPEDLAEAVRAVRQVQRVRQAEAAELRPRGWQNPGVRGVLLDDVELAAVVFQLAQRYPLRKVRAALKISRQGLRDVVLHHGQQTLADHQRRSA